jgi:hypothetical protein
MNEDTKVVFEMSSSGRPDVKQQDKEIRQKILRLVYTFGAVY